MKLILVQRWRSDVPELKLAATCFMPTGVGWAADDLLDNSERVLVCTRCRGSSACGAGLRCGRDGRDCGCGGRRHRSSGRRSRSRHGSSCGRSASIAQSGGGRSFSDPRYFDVFENFVRDIEVAMVPFF